jgi:hypothetical protein
MHLKDEEAYQLEHYPPLVNVADFNVEVDPRALYFPVNSGLQGGRTKHTCLCHFRGLADWVKGKGKEKGDGEKLL